jgi:hypothetical protein
MSPPEQRVEIRFWQFRKPPSVVITIATNLRQLADELAELVGSEFSVFVQTSLC